MAKRFFLPSAVAKMKGVTRDAIAKAIERGDIVVDVELIGPEGNVRAQGISEETLDAWSPSRTSAEPDSTPRKKSKRRP